MKRIPGVPEKRLPGIRDAAAGRIKGRFPENGFLWCWPVQAVHLKEAKPLLFLLCVRVFVIQAVHLKGRSIAYGRSISGQGSRLFYWRVYAGKRPDRSKAFVRSNGARMKHPLSDEVFTVCFSRS